MIYLPRLARGFSLLSAYQKATTKTVVAHFNFTANFADVLGGFFLYHVPLRCVSCSFLDQRVRAVHTVRPRKVVQNAADGTDQRALGRGRKDDDVRRSVKMEDAVPHVVGVHAVLDLTGGGKAATVDDAAVVGADRQKKDELFPIPRAREPLFGG